MNEILTSKDIFTKQEGIFTKSLSDNSMPGINKKTFFKNHVSHNTAFNIFFKKINVFIKAVE